MPIPTSIDELALYLRPPGQGIYTVSSGKQEAINFTNHYLQKETVDWRTHLEDIPNHTKALLALPSDAGAGILRGAMRGPQGIREVLQHAPVFDLGDVFSIPHFINDDMLSAAQRYASQDALYPEVPLPKRRSLPVAPMSIALRVLDIIRELNPNLKIHLLGGDHTCAWPMCEWLLKDLPAEHDVGIIHFDAHTDMLEERLGVKYCFGTWAYHANELLGRNSRLVQIGIRATGHPQQYWEENFQVKQIWAQEALAMQPEALGQMVVDYLNQRGIRRVYISNDIDGTDRFWAAACGTPEPNGLTPDHVLAVIKAMKNANITVLAADIVEVAPVLSLDKDAAQRTLETAVSYLKAQLEAM